MDDLIADILARITEQVAAQRIDLSALEASIRRDWGGERHYIARQGEDYRSRISQRDARIREQFRQGEHVPFLARRWDLSERHIRRIVRL